MSQPPGKPARVRRVAARRWRVAQFSGGSGHDLSAHAVESPRRTTPTRARIARMRRFLNFATTADDDRGDVPGWVLITLMTAGLVILIWALAGPALQGVFQQAIDRVTGF